MANAPTVNDVAVLRRATGWPLLYCRDMLRDASPVVREKLLAAAHNQEGANYFRDPIEDDPVLAAAFEDSRREASSLVEEVVAARRAKLAAEGMAHLDYMLRGTCHLYWHHLKRLLKERHGVDWLTPAEMNPHTHFD